MSDIPDKDLIQRAKEGDKNAYEELFSRHSGKVKSFLCKYMDDYQKAEEVTIDTFLDVYKRLPGYREEGKFLSWVYAIAVNYAKKEFRKRKGIREVSIDSPIDEDKKVSMGDLIGSDRSGPDKHAIAEELRKNIDSIIADLDEKYRSVLLLCDMQDITHEEAARILKCTKITLGVRLNRARQMLRDKLKKLGYDL